MAMVTVAARGAVTLAAYEAEQLGSPNIDCEHVFLGLCKIDSFRELSAEDAGLSQEAASELRQEIAAFLAALGGTGFDAVRARRRMRELWHASNPERDAFTGHRTPRCRQLFGQAEALASGAITLAVLMRALLASPSHDLMRVLTEQNCDRVALSAAMEKIMPAAAPAGAGGETARGASTAVQYGRDLTRLARDGKLQAALGRDDEMKRVARILLQAKKNNPILVGDAGVGKTAIVEGLALRAIEPAAPEALQKIRIVEVSLGALVAGTKYRGQFEERLQAIIAEAEADPSLVVFFDEVHMLLGAGEAGGSMDAANLLKPALARGTLRCIGATTTAEYRKHIEKDAALERRFQVVWVEEPSRETAIEILNGLRPRLEEHHGVHITPAAIRAAVDLSIRYLADFRLPDKAIDLVDQACARIKLASFTARPASASRKDAGEVGPDEVAVVVAERCRVPVERITVEESQRLLQMEDILRRRVKGQDQAVQAVSEAVRSAKTALRDPRRPLGVFLFLGPTGTGKTELAKSLAEFLFGDERLLIRIDMSEYGEKHSVAKLIGSPPGYIGHDEGGQLTDKVRTHPYSVVLFDEIEKAHSAVFDLFLQIFDEGRLTDSRGRTVSFAEAVVILTSNIGGEAQAAAPRRHIGITLDSDAGGETTGPAQHKREDAAAPGKPGSADPAGWAAYEQRVREAVGRVLRPEIRNRIQKEIVFHPLGREVIAQIADKILSQLNSRLAQDEIRVEVSAGARSLLMSRGFSEQFGARAMERAVHDLIEEPLSRMMLQGRVSRGDLVRVTEQAGAMKLETAERGTTA